MEPLRVAMTDSKNHTEKRGVVEIRIKESNEMIRTPHDILDDYGINNMPNDVKRVIALFAGQAALEDDRILQSVCGE
jgi:hypothetical protein